MRLPSIKRLGAGIGLLCVVVLPASADDLKPVRIDLERTLPEQALERVFAAPPLVFRGVPPRAPAVYRECVNGVVLIAPSNTVCRAAGGPGHGGDATRAR